MRKELTKESEGSVVEQAETQEEGNKNQEVPRQETLNAAEVLDIAEGNLIRALNAIRMLK